MGGKKQLLQLLITVSSVWAYNLRNPVLRRSTLLGESGGLGIYDGSKTTINKHPYIVALIKDGNFYCEGTIVSISWVVTICDCVDGASPDQFTVLAGTNDGSSGQIHEVEFIVMHPNYDYDTFDYEFACVQIKDKFQYSDKVKPIKLPQVPPKTNTNMIVAGWGATSNGESLQLNTLLQGKMKWLSQKMCTSTYAGQGVTVTDRMACAYDQGETTLCDGDWGNAFVNNDVFYAMMVAGGETGWCSSSAIPVLLANVSSEAEWIKTITGAKFENE